MWLQDIRRFFEETFSNIWKYYKYFNGSRKKVIRISFKYLFNLLLFEKSNLIINIQNFSRGFVTFDKTEAAERAISEMDGSMVSSIQLKVSLARRQPIIESMTDATSSSMWSPIAANYSQKSAHKDRRDLKVYEEDLFM